MPAELKKGGVILVDKPYKWTSFDAVNHIKISLKAKIGHCGTLDPLATGLLICCSGAMTKQISGFQQLPKEYTGIFHLGASTATYEQVYVAALQLTGNIMQVPPIHSAIKRDGKRSYDLARAGVDVVLEPRPVIVSEFEITAINLPEVHFRVVCSTGTYIRSLAQDIGQILGCGAYLQELRRTKIGNFDVSDALTPGQWKDLWKPRDTKTDKEENTPAI